MKILFVSILGGHLEQLLSLKPTMKQYESYIITEENSSTLKLKEKHSNISFIPYISRSNYLSFAWSFISIIYHSIIHFYKIKPEVIITTGSGCVLPICLIGKIHGKKIIFIETFSRVHSKTLTGRICYYLADK